MTTRESHRTLTAHLAAWDAPRITRLLVRRPDLVRPQPPSDRAELANRAQQYASVVAAIGSTTLAENRLLQVLVCCRPDAPLGEVAAALPEGLAMADIEEVLASLEALALVWRHDGRIHSSGTLRQAMPTSLGPPAQTLLRDQTVDYLRAAIPLLRAAAVDRDLTLPPRATGPGGQLPRKAELVDELASLLAAPGVVDAVLASGGDVAAGLAMAMADGKPLITVDHPMYYSRYSSYYTREPTYWLYERALLLPVSDGDVAAQPREVAVALRGGRPVSDLALQKPALVTGAPVDATAVDGVAAERAVLTVERLTDLVSAWASSPVTMLKGGGLGVTVLKQVAAAHDTDVTEAARLVELASLAGMLETKLVHHGTGRRATYETIVTVTAAAREWSERSLPTRWAQLAGAWVRAEHWPSATGRKAPGTKSIPVLKYVYAPGAHERRREVLGVLASMAPGESTTVAALAGAVFWDRPQPWLHVDAAHAATAIGWVYEEAELLGVAASGALSTFGRSVAAGDAAGAEGALIAARPEPVRAFTLQADLTATAFGTLDRDVLLELRLLADQESHGAATTYRFSYSSLRRAFDAGRDAEGILAFLEAHADKGVPGPLSYLVADVARRHGHIQVGGAGSFVVGEDPAVMADACSHRQTRKLGLRLLAPTVAVSPHPPAKVIDGLREAGFLPTDHPGEPATVKVAATAAAEVALPAAGGRRKGQAEAGGLPEPFRPGRSLRPPPAAPIDEEAAANVAAMIVAAKPARPILPARPASPARTALDEELEDVLETAHRETRVVAISVANLPNPIVMVVTYWESGRVVGTDLVDGDTAVIPTAHITAIVDLGPITDLDPAAFGDPDLPPTTRRPTRRRRR